MYFQIFRQSISVKIAQILLPVSVSESVHYPVCLLLIDQLADIRLKVSDGICIFLAHEHIGIYIIPVHIRRIVFFDPVQTILRVIRAGNINIIIVIQHGKGAVYTFSLSYLNRRCVAQRSMYQHFSALCVLSQLEDIEIIVFSIGSPVVLRRLEGIIHLIQPSAYKSRILRDCRYYAASSVKSTCKGSVLRRDVSCICCQRRQRHPVLKIVDVCHIPAEAYAVASGFSFGYICRPLLGKCFRIDQTFFIQLMQPCDSVLIPFLRSGADHFQIVRDSDMSSFVHIPVPFSESVDQDTAVLVAVIYDTGHGDDASLDSELFLDC